MAITTTLVLDAIKRGVTVPASQVRFSDADLLKFCDEEIESTILPMLTSVRQEFLVKKKLVPLVSLQNEYKIPYRAVGRTLRDIKLESNNGTIVKSLAFIQPEDANAFTSISPGDPWAYTVRGDLLVMLPTPSSTNFKIQMFYELKPSYLVPVANAGQISAINTSTGVVTLANAISGFTTGQVMDFVDGQSGCTVKGEDLTNTNVAGTAVTFAASDLPSSLAVGDYVTASNQSPVLQLPDELHQCVVQAAICRILEALGDFEGLQAGSAKLDKKMMAAQQIITPRIESTVPVVINRNGLLNQRPWNYRWRYSL